MDLKWALNFEQHNKKESGPQSKQNTTTCNKPRQRKTTRELIAELNSILEQFSKNWGDWGDAMEILKGFESAKRLLKIKLVGLSDKEKEAHLDTPEAQKIILGAAKYKRVKDIQRELPASKVEEMAVHCFHNSYQFLLVRCFQMEFILTLDTQQLEQSIADRYNIFLETFFDQFRKAHYDWCCGPDDYFLELRAEVLKKLSGLNLFVLDDESDGAITVKMVNHSVWFMFHKLKRLFDKRFAMPRNIQNNITPVLYLPECIKELAQQMALSNEAILHYCVTNKYFSVRYDGQSPFQRKFIERGEKYDEFCNSSHEWEVYLIHRMYETKSLLHAEREFSYLFVDALFEKYHERFVPLCVEAIMELGIVKAPPTNKPGGFMPGRNYQSNSYIADRIYSIELYARPAVSPALPLSLVTLSRSQALSTVWEVRIIEGCY